MAGTGPTQAMLLVAVLLAGPAGPTPLPIRGGDGAIGFDDLRFSPELRAILVPAGHTGRVDLVRGEGVVESLQAFDPVASTGRGHEDGTTSADVGAGRLFAIDRTSRTLAALDPASGRVLARAPLSADPDYVRWVAATGEVWVTEPDRERIEVFRVGPGERPALTPAGTISVPAGPESLVVDATRGRAYTNTFRDATVSIEVASRRIAARWANRCRAARGIALDERRGFLLVGCAEGKAVSLDAGHGGEVLGEAAAGAGVDVIDFAPGLSHLYLPAATDATMVVAGVDARGALHALGTVATAPGAHCVAADDAGEAFVCDPRRGRLLVYRDGHPAAR